MDFILLFVPLVNSLCGRLGRTFVAPPQADETEIPVGRYNNYSSFLVEASTAAKAANPILS